MAKSNTKIIYEEDEDILYLSKTKPSKASVEIGDFVIDVGFDGMITAVEVINASTNLGLDRKILKKLSADAKVVMGVNYRPGYILIRLTFEMKNEKKSISIPLAINLGHKRVEKEEIVFC